MTDKLLCPFCGQEMIGSMVLPVCHFDPDCPIHDNPVPIEVLELLERTRKALGIAIDALNKIDKQLMTGIEMTCQARNALEQITAQEQKD